MIQPEDIRRKAENLYGDFLKAWLDAEDAFFPRVIPARKRPATDDLSSVSHSVRRLREGSKEVLGFGYSVEWQEVNSRKFGRNLFPGRILFETQEDFLRFIGKRREFAALSDAVRRLLGEFPGLKTWIGSNLRPMIEAEPDLEGLLNVLRFFRDHPRPGRFARELPIPVDTKFIERHQQLLRQWFDVVLPPHTIRADEDHFERRYGLRYVEPYFLVRLLDSELKRELAFPCSEFSLPLSTLADLPVRRVAAVIVENKVNLLTLPPLCRGIGLGGLGAGVTLLRNVPWLSRCSVAYWGDIDVEGFEILSSLRTIFPDARSFLMDCDTLHGWKHLAVGGTGRKPDLPPHLTDQEQATFIRCRDSNIRLEQERLPQDKVLAEINHLPSPRNVCP